MWSDGIRISVFMGASFPCDLYVFEFEFALWGLGWVLWLAPGVVRVCV